MGGFWIWCTYCRNFAHGTATFVSWWHDLPAVDAAGLTATPAALVELSKQIDQHWNSLRQG